MRFFLISALLASCGGANNELHSKTQDYVAGRYLEEERRLYVTAGKEGGYCVYQRFGDKETTLITTKGALTADQLGQSLSYMSYGMQIATSGAPTAVTAYAGVRFLQWTTRVYESSQQGLAIPPSTAKKLAKASIYLLLAVVTAHVVNGTYRIIKGNYEGERAGAIAAQFFLGWMPVNFIVEDMQRRGRLETLANKYDRVSISQRKFNSIIAKLDKMTPTWPHACQ